jgi:ABC-type Mn2+/Zn2+ transport system permease subunit
VIVVARERLNVEAVAHAIAAAAAVAAFLQEPPTAVPPNSIPLRPLLLLPPVSTALWPAPKNN